MSFSWNDRLATLAGLGTQPPELIIIGGGIAGLSTAAHAAKLGLNVLLIEKDDIASGATGNSTGLAHAGLRYLAQGQVGYVFREGHERYRLQELAPQWVQPIQFILPSYQGDPFPFWMVRLGTFLYDALAWVDALWCKRSFAKAHRKLSAEQVKGRIPGLRAEGLVGGLEYFVDAKLLDSRFALGYAQQAFKNGAQILTHCCVESITRTGTGATIVLGRDLLTQKEIRLIAPLVINATGAWIDETRKKLELGEPIIQKSKGIHLIVDHLVNTPMIMASAVKGKVFFVLPIDDERSLVGTTDTPVHVDVDAVHADDKDVGELLQQLFYYFPYLKQGPNLLEAIENYKRVHVRDTYWAVRPLVAQNKSTVHASRDHKLVKEGDQFWSLAGVKLTAGRVAGLETALEAWETLRKGIAPPKVTWDSLPGGELWDFDHFAQEAAKRFKLGDDPLVLLRYLVSLYGTRYVEVLQWAQKAEEFGSPVIAGEPWMMAQVPYAVHEEMVLTLNDLLWRRTKWAHYRDLPNETVDAIARIMGRTLGWTEQEVRQNMRDYQSELLKHRHFRA